MTFFQLFWLFICYSFFGWAGEVAVTALRERRYRDRGVLGGPLCLIYGVTGCLLTVGLRELAREDLFFLFLFSAVIATAIEWTGGHILEWLTHARWWDYSDKKFNFQGRICLIGAVVFGLFSVVLILFIHPFTVSLTEKIPPLILIIFTSVMLCAFISDIFITVKGFTGLESKLKELAELILNSDEKHPILKMFSRQQNRMIRSFPKLKSLKYNETLQNYRNALKKLRKK